VGVFDGDMQLARALTEIHAGKRERVSFPGLEVNPDQRGRLV
jgi:hypothetical protein